MNETAISVAMATCNGERFLQEQLDSLARQTQKPFELVVCDDRSADGTVEILRRFATSAPFRVRIYQNETQLGPGFNSLSALGRCAGDLVALCDQDDVWKESKLRVCTEVMRDPVVALVSHSATVFSLQPLARRWRYPDHRSCVWRGCGDFAAHRWELLGFTLVLRRAVLNSAHVPEYSAVLSPWCAHDVWATAAALSCGQVVLLPDELSFYRLHENNASLRPHAKGLMRVPPDPSGLERGAKNFAGLAKFLRYAASFCDEPARQMFYNYVGQVERSGSLCGERAQLHRACGRRLTAIRTLAGMLAKGNYAPRSLGVNAFIRDALLAAFWTAHELAVTDTAFASQDISTPSKSTVT
jgi:glycosyltransferase involved in cell wall biosynthesis